LDLSPFLQFKWLICSSPDCTHWYTHQDGERLIGLFELLALVTLAQISHRTLSLIKSLVFAIGWTGRCCLYPLVSRGNCRWLGTVSFTTNLCCLQPKAPNRHRCFRVFECTPVAFIAGRFLPFLFTRVLCSLWKYHRAPTNSICAST